LRSGFAQRKGIFAKQNDSQPSYPLTVRAVRSSFSFSSMLRRFEDGEHALKLHPLEARDDVHRAHFLNSADLQDAGAGGLRLYARG
jgi:hypothetical protein